MKTNRLNSVFSILKILAVPVIICIIFLASITKGYSQQEKFYALYLEKFSVNMTFPENAEKIKIGVFGDDDVLSHLNNYTKYRANVEGTRVLNALDMQDCHILYVSKEKEAQIENYLSRVPNKQILIVTESGAPVGNGSDIGFIEKDGRISFLASESSLEAKNLKLSYKVKSLGETI